MDGVILFSDDHIFSNDRPEANLYKELQKEVPVLGVESLDLAKTAIRSIGSFKAIILDWQYGEDDDDDDIFKEAARELGKEKVIETPSSIENAALNFLMENDFYSLVYIFSEKDIKELHGKELKDKFGDRIRIRSKDNFIQETVLEYKKEILEEIEKWQVDNENLSIPIQWSGAINESIQKIFKELSEADPYWINELYETALKDGVIPEVEVINLFQNLLAEAVIQNENLREIIKNSYDENKSISNPESYAKIIRILYYMDLDSADPIMTGDIFQFEDDSYGILINPECDIRHIVDNSEASFEFLTFSSNSFTKSDFRLKTKIKASLIYELAEKLINSHGDEHNMNDLKNYEFTKGQKQKMAIKLNEHIANAEHNLQIQAFTQTNNPRYHLIPCFEFSKGDYSGIAKIDFRKDIKVVKSENLTIEKRVAKLNTPYIQELRQRFLAYRGRVGVPGYSLELRKWLLEKN